MRTHTPPRKKFDPDTGRVVTTYKVQRCCNGCGHKIGDVTLAEIDAGIGGLPLPDVRHECPWCAPFLAEGGTDA